MARQLSHETQQRGKKGHQPDGATPIPTPAQAGESDTAAIARYRRAANYLAAAQIYLKGNFLLEEPLRPEHIKDRLLGHWGTCPGINLVYAHLNQLILRHDLDMFLVTGPGHGAPANLANLYLEGTLADFYPELTLDREGLGQFVKRFSWPGGFPSHLYPGVPGTIHEGGELGYALATAFGAAMDNPELIVGCIVGDGEAETGPTATAWHSYKFIDPVGDGAVLPVVHINGYKISNPTIYGSMSDDDLRALFTGYGYAPRFVEGDSDALDVTMGEAMEWAYGEIRRIQEAARAGQRIAEPRWPVILMRTLKGWTGPKELHGEPVEGSYRAHQVPVPDAKTNPASLRIVEEWLRSYRPQELFDANGRPAPDILAQCPSGDRRMGSNPHTLGGRLRKPLNRPDINTYAVRLDKGPTGALQRGVSSASNMERAALYLRDVIVRNRHQFRIVSPDELESNKLSAVFEVTHRNYQWPARARYTSHIGQHDGRVLEVLSEHDCQAWLQGYLLTGRYGLFPSYEAFLNIVTSMMDQFAKFLEMSANFSWRLPIASLNYLETSTLWRQEHNGFSHQNPGFINSILNLKASVARVYLPPDANCLLTTLDHCLRSVDYVNLVIANKPVMPQWLTMDEAVAHCRAGASVWGWASTEEGVSPDVVLVGIGDNPMLEIMAAADILLHELPELRIRVVNVTDLLVMAKGSEHPHGLDEEMFHALFTADRPVIVNFHGYPSAARQLLYGRHHQARFIINGYREEGTTTTPFDMNVRNGTDRYHIITQAIRLAAASNPLVAARASERVHHYEYVLNDFRDYIEEHGTDPDEIASWQWSR